MSATSKINNKMVEKAKLLNYTMLFNVLKAYHKSWKDVHFKTVEVKLTDNEKEQEKLYLALFRPLLVHLRECEFSLKQSEKFIFTVLKINGSDTSIDTTTAWVDKNMDILEPNLKMYFFRFMKIKRPELFMRFIESVESNGLNFHEVINAFPKFDTKKINDFGYLDARIATMESIVSAISVYKSVNVLRMLPYMNFSRVREGKSIEEIMQGVTFIESTIARKQLLNNTRELERRFLNVSIEGSTFKRKISEGHAPMIKHIRESNQVRFSKENYEIMNIGNKTNCCFRKGGAAESLMYETLISPLCGILTGNIGKGTWFSMVWEIMEKNEKGFYDLNLVLDNIEATIGVDVMCIIDKIKATKMYKKIYLGTLRNDITNLPDAIKDTAKLRPRCLVGGEANFQKYGSFDDSKNIYTIIENDDDLDVEAENMCDNGHFLSAYIERDIYRKDKKYFGDVEYLTIVQNTDLSFIFKSTTSVFGYLTTSRKTEKEIKYLKLADEIKEGNHIYIDDFVLLSQYPLRKFYKQIMDKYREYIAANPEIEYICFSSNNNSKSYIKRMVNESGLKFIEDTQGIKTTPKSPLKK